MSSDPTKIAVVGGGLIGLVSALALSEVSRPDVEVTLIAPIQKVPDKRTTAILMPAVEFLRDLGTWGDLETVSAHLKTMRIADASGRLISAPPVEFNASEIGTEAFGYNVPNEQASVLLRAALEKKNNVTLVDAIAVSLDIEKNILKTSDGRKLRADLFIAADGRHSVLREAAGINVARWSYPQTALAITFAHTLPHGGVSTELHTRTGPFTQVPLPSTVKHKHRSSLVWVLSPSEAKEWAKADADVLSREIERRLQSSLGEVTVEGPSQSFPLSGMTAHSLAKGNVMLVGEAAHVIPPIGAQGFNLGISDVEALARLIADGITPGQMAAKYNRERRPEIFAKTGGIDLLNRSLLSGFLPLHLGRSAALSALSHSPLLRRVLMKGVMDGPRVLVGQTTSPESMPTR